ncbi:LysR family transcriptional regulator substrate-binding protein [Brevibacillus humidisoli]|nr:LysR family transcriptional regulator substrate-binding protein [Brevibacillus humidisoli]UFJ41530.1 LysR family transcriptional regulator substrate-binding protein [Brevibacillus humidisoli]
MRWVRTAPSWIEQSIADIGFDSLPNAKVEAIPLWEDEMVVCLPDTHPLSQHPFLSVSQFVDKCFIMP